MARLLFQGVHKKIGLQNPDNPDIILTFLAKNPDIFTYVVFKKLTFGGVKKNALLHTQIIFQ